MTRLSELYSRFYTNKMLYINNIHFIILLHVNQFNRFIFKYVWDDNKYSFLLGGYSLLFSRGRPQHHQNNQALEQKTVHDISTKIDLLSKGSITRGVMGVYQSHNEENNCLQVYFERTVTCAQWCKLALYMCTALGI